MLKTPYEYVYQVGNTNYYYLHIQDIPYKFLVGEVFERIIEHTPRFLRKPKQKEIELTFAMKSLPLNSVLLFILYNALELKPYTYELDVNENKVDVYQTWSDYDIKDVQDAFKQFLKQAKDDSNYFVPPTIKNPVSKGYDKDGYTFFALEKNGSYARTFWNIRTTETGALHLVAVNEVGTEAKPITMSVDTFLLDRALMEIIMEDFRNGRLIPDGEEVKIEDETEKEKN